jgi:Icc-related predicted phosphoesterase
MKIFAIGDFHGKFPQKLKKRIKKESPDLIVSIGDYPTFSLKKLFFKHTYGKDKEVWDIIGKSKFKKLVENDWRSGENVIRKLSKLPFPIITTIGNYDGVIQDSHDPEKVQHLKNRKRWEWYEQDFFSKIMKKYQNIKRIEYSSFKIKDIVFIGGYGHSFPGEVRSRNFRRYKKKLDALFRKFRKENKEKKVIFIFHNMPYKSGLDKIRSRNAPKEARGEYYGSKINRRIIDQYQPILGIGGHFHENQGKTRLKKTTVINVGSASEGKAAIIDYNEDKGKINKIRFIK